MLYSTGAQAQSISASTATISGVVTDLDGKPVGNASVTASGPANLSGMTNAAGVFTIPGLPYGVYTIVVNSRLLGFASKSGIAVGGDISVSIRYEVSKEPGITTIGVVSTSTRAAFNVTPASVASISPSQEALSGETSWRRILERIPGVTTVNQGGGSYVNDDVVDGPQVNAILSINGALPYETATLIDGLPLEGRGFSSTAGGGYDLALLPLNGFNDADIVRGPGADSPSIVNSIGGSFVLHPADRVTHNSFDLTTSSDPYGGFNSTAIAALRLSKLSVRLAYSVNDSPGPINAPEPASINLKNAATIDGHPFYCAGTCAQVISPSQYSDFVRSTYGNVACCFNDSTAWAQHGGSISLSYDVSPAVTASAFYSGLQSNEPLSYAISSFDFTPPAGYTNGTYPAGFVNAYCLITPNCQYPIIDGSSLFFERVSARLGPGSLELAALQNNTFESSATAQSQTFAAHLFGGGAYGTVANNTPVIFNGGTYTITSLPTLTASSYSSAFDVNRDYLISYNVPIGAEGHVGFSYVDEFYNTPSSYSSITFAGKSSSGGTSALNYFRSHEFRLWGGTEITRRIDVEFSLYSTAATYHVQNPANVADYINERFPYTAPRAGVTWRPSANVAIRGSAGGGYALQPLGDEIGTNGEPALSNGQYSESVANVNLKPETSFGFDVGTDLRFGPVTVLSFDLYRTNLYGQIYSSSSQQGYLNGLPLFVSQYGNIGQSRYEGLNFDLRHDPIRGPYYHLAAGFTRAYVVSVPAGFYNTATCTLCNNLAIVQGPNFSGAYSNSVPYSQANATIGFRLAPRKSIEVTANYFGPGNSYYEPAFTEFDARASYPIAKHVAVGLRFQNITNIYGAGIRTEYDNFPAPVVAGKPYGLFSNPYGPRALLVSSSFSF